MKLVRFHRSKNTGNDTNEHGKQKLTLDSTGSLSDTTQYRIVLSGEDTETYREVTTEDGTFNTERKSLNVSPSITYTPDDQNTFTLRLNHSDQELPIDRGTVMVDDGSGNLSIADIPYERALGSENDIRDTTDDLIQFDWDFERDFAPVFAPDFDSEFAPDFAKPSP